jgi:chromosome segregation ATPase
VKIKHDELALFKENNMKNEKEHIQMSNEVHILKMEIESLKKEMKKTKDNIFHMENDNKQKDRVIKDLNDQLKDYDIKLNLKDSTISDLEMKVSRNMQMMNDSEELSLEMKNSQGSRLLSQEDTRAKLEEESKKVREYEEVNQRINDLKETMEKQKTSSSEQIKKLTDKIEELRRENMALQKEKENLTDSLQNNKKEREQQENKREVKKDESSIMSEFLGKVLELEDKVQRYKLKSDELTKQLLGDREYYNSSLSILYTLAAQNASAL